MAKRKKRSASLTPAIDPQQLARAFQPLLSPEEFALLVNEVEQPLPPAIRLNPLKTAAGFENTLSASYGWQLEPLPFCPLGFRVATNEGPSVSATLEHRLSMYYVQEAASMLPVELFSFDPSDDALTLDMAASPGGKTTHLVSRGMDRGLVIANDSSQGRIQALRIVLHNWGAVNTAITRFPGEKFGSWFPGVFDRVLLDAPCSMQGLRTAESHPAKPVTPREIQQLSQRQAALLESALRAVKTGGEVVYSTCTLMPDEDEAVVDAVLKKSAGGVELLDAQRVLPRPAPGLSSAGDALYSLNMEKVIRLWPHRYHTAGFFACLLRKVAPLDHATEPPPVRPMERVGFHPLSAQEETAICQRFLDDFGFNLSQDLRANNRVLVQHFEEVHLFPARLLLEFPDLPLQSAGLLLGQHTPDGFLPSHEWVARFGASCQKNRVILDENQTRLWMNGDNLEISLPGTATSNRYRVVLNQAGQAIGRAKTSAAGLKNLLPRRLL